MPQSITEALAARITYSDDLAPVDYASLPPAARALLELLAVLSEDYGGRTSFHINKSLIMLRQQERGTLRDVFPDTTAEQLETKEVAIALLRQVALRVDVLLGRACASAKPALGYRFSSLPIIDSWLKTIDYGSKLSESFNSRALRSCFTHDRNLSPGSRVLATWFEQDFVNYVKAGKVTPGPADKLFPLLVLLNNHYAGAFARGDWPAQIPTDKQEVFDALVMLLVTHVTNPKLLFPLLVTLSEAQDGLKINRQSCPKEYLGHFTLLNQLNGSPKVVKAMVLAAAAEDKDWFKATQASSAISATAGRLIWEHLLAANNKDFAKLLLAGFDQAAFNSIVKNADFFDLSFGPLLIARKKELLASPSPNPRSAQSGLRGAEAALG